MWSMSFSVCVCVCDYNFIYTCEPKIILMLELGNFCGALTLVRNFNILITSVIQKISAKLEYFHCMRPGDNIVQGQTVACCECGRVIMTKHFIFHICRISVLRFLYFNFFSDSCTTFLCDGIAMSISKQILSFLFLIIMSDLFSRTSLSVCLYPLIPQYCYILMFTY
jgi:hypothetical protein